MTIRNERKAAASNPSGCCTLVGEEPAAERKAAHSANSNSCALVGELPTGERKAIASSTYNNCALVGERTSSLSYNGTSCVQVGEAVPAGKEHVITLRDSKEVRAAGARAQTLAFTPDEWRAFLDGVRKGEFDLDGSGHLPPVPARAT